MKLFLLLAINFFNCDGARILGIIPTPSYSHQVFFQPLWRELSLRGHQVTVLTTDPINDPLLTNLTEIDLHFSYKEFGIVIDKFKAGFFGGFDALIKGMINIVESQVQHPEVQELLNNETTQFDVMLIEYFYPIMFGFPKKYKCPAIGVLSIEAPARIHQVMGSPSHPVLYPEVAIPTLPHEKDLNFVYRLLSTLYSVFVPLIYTRYLPEMESSAKKLFNVENLSFRDNTPKIDMVFVNSNPVLTPVRPLPPNFVEIGGGIHIKPPKPLPTDLQIYLDNAKEGFIYFSLGTNAKSKDLPQSLLNIFMQTFSKLPYKILWKFENEELAGKPENVMIAKWLPQQDVLRHPNIKLFIFQCGSQSTEESILSKVPVLGIPMIGDQNYNARLVVIKGWGLVLDSTSLTEDNLESTILELINNPQYRNKAEELGNLMVDQPMTPLEKAVWWTEYVIRHKGAKHFRNPAVDIPLYQYYLLDVISFCLLIVIILIGLVYTAFKVCFKCLCYLTKRLKTKVD